MIKEIIPNIIKSPLIVDPLCCIRSSEEIMMMMPKTNIVIIPNTIPNMPIPKNLEESSAPSIFLSSIELLIIVLTYSIFSPTSTIRSFFIF